MIRKMAWFALSCVATSQAVACFTVYDRTNAIVYYAQTPPVDMTPPFNDRLQKVFPGSHLVFGDTTGCPVKQAGYNPARPPAASSPLFTDKQTAEELKLGHTVLPNGAALVAAPPAGMRPGFTVMNLGGPLATAPVAPRPLASSGKSSPVITELRDPPRTFTDDRGRISGETR